MAGAPNCTDTAVKPSRRDVIGEKYTTRSSIADVSDRSSPVAARDEGYVNNLMVFDKIGIPYPTSFIII